METSRLVSFYDLIQVEDLGVAAKDDSTTADADVVKDSSAVPITLTDKDGTTTATLTEE